MQMNNMGGRGVEGAFEIQTIDYRKIFFSLWRRKVWFILSIAIAIILGWFYNRYQVRTYRVSSKCLIEEENKGLASDLSMEAMTQGFELKSGYSHFDNQLVLIKSYGVLEEAVIRMKQKAAIFVEGNVVKRRIFENAPFLFDCNTEVPQIIGTVGHLEYLGDHKWHFTSVKSETPLFQYNFSQRQKLSTLSFGHDIDTVFVDHLHLQRPGMDFHISSVDSRLRSLAIGSKYEVCLYDYHWWVNYYKGQLAVSPLSKETTILKFSMITATPKEGVAFLDTLMQTVVDRGLMKKNEVADRTISFVNQQLKQLSSELSQTEADLATFQAENKMVKLSQQAEAVYGKMQSLETDKKKMEMRLRYYRYLQTYLQKRSREGLLTPSSMGIEDPLMFSMVGQINKLLDEQTVLQKAGVTNMQRLSTIKNELQHLTVTLNENVHQMIHNISLQKDGVEQRMQQMSADMQSLPEVERTYLNIQRKFKVNDNIYSYLLQRRTEASITKASNTSNVSVVEVARQDSNTPVSPKVMINYLVFILLGVMLPTIAVMIEIYFFDHIVGLSDMKELVGVAPLAMIGHSNCGVKPVLTDADTEISEQFRALRVRLAHAFKDNTAPVFLFTSTLAGDGKSFVSINTALSFALLGKKTVLIGADLRKPRLQSEFEDGHGVGLSEFLSGEVDNIYEIIRPQENTPLDVIFSGSYGQESPVDLLSHGRMGILLTELKKSYDYILIDTAPLGISFDTFNLLNRADQVIYVSRSHKTPKSKIKNVREQMKKYLPNSKIGYVINDASSKEGAYGYGYGYGYGYSCGYGQEKKKNKCLHRIISRVKK
jgi:capsular exopolysaccharide synthesis family protein